MFKCEFNSAIVMLLSLTLTSVVLHHVLIVAVRRRQIHPHLDYLLLLLTHKLTAAGQQLSFQHYHSTFTKHTIVFQVQVTNSIHNDHHQHI
jgi:hypothetical protein